VLIGYGRIVIDTPNGDAEGTIDNYGGAFSFSLTDHRINKLSGLPIVTLDIKTMKALSVEENNYSAIEKNLTYSSEKKGFVVSRKRTIQFENDSPYSSYPWRYSKEIADNEEFDRKNAMNLTDVQVEYQTITENAESK
jgi:hypothetical protein